jgi:hypothetical protein
MLLRVRDEARMTLAAYNTVASYETEIACGSRETSVDSAARSDDEKDSSEQVCTHVRIAFHV